MFSLPKILALGAIVVAVWYGFRLVGRLDAARKAKHEGGGADTNARPEPPQSHSSPPKDMKVVDLVQDKETGAFVADDKRDDRA